MTRILARMKKGFQRIVHFHSNNVIKGVHNIVKSGKEFDRNFYQSMEKLILDGIEDIDNRLNKIDTDDSFDSQQEDKDDFDTNILTDFCFGDIYGPNYGIRTFLEFEEECDEESTCAEDIDIDTPTEEERETEPAIDDIERRFDHLLSPNVYDFSHHEG